MVTGKQTVLIQLLLEKNQQMNASQLAGQLGVSVRTIHNYIGAINGEYPDAITSTAHGYRIEPKLARKALNQAPSDIPQTMNDRCNYILNRLVQNGGSLDLYDLCDEIFISTTTFHGLTGRMRRMTRDYDLTLNVSGDTVSLSGTERNKRRLLSSLLYRESAAAFTSIDALQAAFPSIDVEQIRSDVLEVLNEYHYFINDYSLLNLLLHIAIAINRVQNGCVNDNEVDSSALGSAEKDLADQLIRRLERSFSIIFSPAEGYELALLLVSRASALDYQSITMENISHYIGQNSLELAQRLIRDVKEMYDINLDEPEFFVRFALHIHNLLVRATNQAFCKNPLVDELRQTCPLIYDVSVQLSGVIQEQTGISINEDEIAYIALHLGGAMEAQKELASRVPTVLFCPSYYNMDTSLSERLGRKMGDKILITNVFTQEAELSQIKGHDVLVVTTVRLHSVLELPLVVISPFLTNTDCVAISRMVESINLRARRTAFRRNLGAIMSPELFERGSVYQTREQIIHYLCTRLRQMDYTDDDFENDVLEREAISSTAFGQFAVPHTLKMRARKTGMFVYFSRSPIQWGDHAVNMIIMLCFDPQERKIFYDIFEPLSMLLLDASTLRAVMECKDYQGFIDTLVDALN